MKQVVIIGSGLSALSCAIALAEQGVCAKVVSPYTSERAQSVMAAGGINAAIGIDDSPEQHAEDTLKSGGNIAGKELVLEPLSKFPVVADLIVDRKTIYKNLNHAKTYLEGLVTTNKQLHDHQYSIAKCLKCGLCLEVCPNYHPGASFFGAVFANDSYLTTSQSTNKPTELIKEYKTHFGAGCSKALSCQTICPVGIETITSIMKMNRK